MKKLLSRLRGYFVTGFIAVLPLLLTVLVLKWIAGTVDGYVGPRTLFGRTLQKIGYRLTPSESHSLAYVIGILLLFFGILILGALLESRARQSLAAIAQKTVFQLPMVRAIYRTTDKFINLMPGNDMDNMKGMQVVFCRFGEGAASAGTLALMPSSEVYRLDGQDYRIVIIPTAPIPVGGAMLFMPASAIFPTDMSIDAFAGIFVSMGVTAAPFQIASAIGAGGANESGPKPG